MSDNNGARDYEAIDISPLREAEIRELRLLLEQDRARRRLSRKMKYYTTWLSLGATISVAGHQFGVVDWIAGLIVKWRG